MFLIACLSFIFVLYLFFSVCFFFRLFRYDGEESLLLNGGFQAACNIASMALESCALHLETGGAWLVAALLNRKNLPVPIPVDRVAELIRSCDRSLLPAIPDGKKQVSSPLFRRH